MADETSTELAKQRTTLAGDRTGLAHERTDVALDRTMLAHDRTLMAWTRTATSLISFGFTIYTFFKNTHKEDTSGQLINSAHFALAMITTGLVCLVLATLRHWHDIRDMERQYGAKPRYLSVVLAGLVSLLGILGFVAVAFRT